jgi:effector-binding domain-containing protein
MNAKAFAYCRLAALGCALMFGAPFLIGGSSAQQAAPSASPATLAAPPSAAPATNPAVSAPAPTPSPAPAPAAAPSASPAAPATTAPAPAASAPAIAPPATAPTAPANPTNPPAAAAPNAPSPDADDSSSGQLLAMDARPAAYVEGKANWSEGFAALTAAFAQIKGEVAKAGLATAAHPIAVFTATDDNGFSYRAMIPIDKAPEGKTALSDSVKLGQTPAGKAMKFEHRGSYEDIDSTYEAITAYLDEKGLEADNLFVEEYLNEVKTPDDPNLQVDIYVLLK